MDIPKVPFENIANSLAEIDTEANKVNDEYEFIDADTLRGKEGDSIRIDNFNAPETFKPNDPTKEFHTAGEVTHTELARIAKERGFTEVFKTGNKDYYDRDIGDLVNPNTGERFSHYAIQQGLVPMTAWSSTEAVDAAITGTSARVWGNEEAKAKMMAEDEAFQNILAEGGMDGFKGNAYNEQYYDEDLHSGVALRRLDRTIDNQAKSQFGTSWDAGWIGLQESFAGFKQMLGDAVGSESLETSGKLGVATAREKLIDLPEVTIDLEDVDGLGDFGNYIANNAAMSVPYMANTVGSALVGAGAGALVGGPVGAAGGLVIGLSSPTAAYSGQVYNSQDDKNVKAALASGFGQAVLDRVGLKGAGVSFGRAPTMKGVLGEAQKQLVAKGYSKREAARMVKEAGKAELRSYLDDAVAVSKQQLSARNLTRTIVRRASQGMGAEAVTESIQETLAHMGENWNQEDYAFFDYDGFNDELINRLTNAAVAGGTLGGAFGTFSGLREAGADADFAWDLTEADPTFEDLLAEKESVNAGKTLDQRMSEMRRNKANTTDLAFRIANNQQTQADKSMKDRALETMTNAPILWRGMMRARIKKDDLIKSAAWRQLSAKFGGTLGRIMPGRNYEDDVHINSMRYKNMVTNEPKLFYQGYNGIRNDKKAQQEFNKKWDRVSQDYNDWFENNWDYRNNRVRDGGVEYDWSKWDGDNTKGFMTISNDPTKNMWQQLHERLNETSEAMRAKQNYWWSLNAEPGKYLDPKFKKLNNYFMKYKAMKKEEVAKHRGKFEDKLRSEYGMSQEAATTLTSKILDNEPLDGHDDNVFNLIMKGVPATAAKARKMGLSQNPEFKEFFHSDLFHNLHEATRQAARFETYHKYVGRDNWRIAQELDKAAQEGVPQEEVNKMALSIQNFLEAQSGNYKRPAPGTYGDRFLGVQKALLTWSLLTSLTLSALSSTVELALTVGGLKSNQIFGKDKGLHAAGYQLATMMGRGMRRLSDELFTGREYLPNSPEYEMLRTLGYTQWETGAATTVGATETSTAAQGWIDKFFKYNGLQGLTNTTRTIRLATFVDASMGWFEEMNQNDPNTKAYKYAARQLRDLGVDPEGFKDRMERDSAGTLTDQEKAQLDEELRLAMYTYINQSVALPGTANRPLFYQDPRLALFTQFNGYIATFTANHLPRLWRDYIKDGPPSIKFNTFAMMALMIMLGFASQYLKDWLKYGEPSPYLDDSEKIRRAINSSGLLGQGERVLNFVWPTFERNPSNFMEAAVGTVFDEMPAMSPLERMYKGADAFYEGEGSKGVYNIARGSPVIGPMTSLAEMLSGQDFSN